jgi:hypothetical protein
MLTSRLTRAYIQHDPRRVKLTLKDRQGNGNQLDARNMGAAAALQALKKFTGAGGEQQPAAAAGGGQTKLVSGSSSSFCIRH